MTGPRAGARAGYLLDAGPSTGIAEAVAPLLVEVRDMLGADAALVVYRPSRAAAGDAVGRVVVGSVLAPAAGAVEPLLPNEPVLLGSALHRLRPQVLVDLDVTSGVRPYRLRLRSAVSVPWRDAFGVGHVIVGNVARPLPAASERQVQQRCAWRLSATVRRGRRDGAERIDRALQAALAEVADATASSDDAGAALASILVSARDLFGSEVAYLSLPEYDTETFTFDQVLGIRTPAFRHLRIDLGQGLGGLARSVRRPVRSLDYASDPKLHAAPVAETVHEGIVSAMATPLLVDDEVKAVLYVGDRHLRPFTPTDEAVLGEFAGYATLALKRRAVEQYRSEVVAQQERERLAYAVHDTVVRRLLEIGFEAEAAARTADEDGRRRMAVIGLAAEQCMDALRGQLAALVGEPSPRRAASSVLEEILSTQRTAGVERTSELRGVQPEELVAGPVADALVKIGQEALTNAEIHSGCGREHVVLELTAGAICLTVEDDGRGLDDAALDGILSGAGSHLGVRAMHAAAARVGGQVTVGVSSSLGGVAVGAAIPT